MRTRMKRAGVAARVIGAAAVAWAGTALAYGVVTPPQRLDAAAAAYPAGASGDAEVTLTLTIDTEGAVTQVAVRGGVEPFASAAVASARGWRFRPALRDDAPIAARITAVVTFRAPPPVPAVRPGLARARATEQAATVASPTEITVRGEREEPSTVHIPRAQTRFVAGAFGDPFKVVEVLPGMAPWLSGLPYYFVRGAPPETVGYFVDGIRVPLLFHVGPGPSTIAPALVDSVDLFPGAYPARYGRYGGAIIAGETTPPIADTAHGELSARFYDANAFVEAPFDGGRGTVSAGGRYAYTGPLTSLIVPHYFLGYWDYQLRAAHRVGERDTLSLFAFGAHDELHYYGQPTFRVEYHRIDLRLDHPTAHGRLRVAFTFDDDDALTAPQTTAGAGATAARRSGGWRLRTESEERVVASVRVRAGADIGATRFTLDQYPSTDGFPASGGPHTDIEGGAYADAVWRPAPRIELVPGARLDGYRTRGRTAWAPQPRLATRVGILPAVSWISALGTAHQEATEAIYVPAKLPYPVAQSSQTTYQFSEALEARLPARMRARVTGFASRLVARDLVGTSQSQVGRSFGLEAFWSRDLTERLGGFVSYTLSRTVEGTPVGTRRVGWDRTHVLSAVAGYDLGRRWRVGARLFVESGRPMEAVCTANCGPSPGGRPAFRTPSGDLPVFWRLDVRLEKTWTFRGGASLTGTLECFNLFDRGEPTGDVAAPDGRVLVTYQSPIILPSIGVEARF